MIYRIWDKLKGALVMALMAVVLLWFFALTWPFVLAGWIMDRRERRFLEDLRDRGGLP